ncbi:copper chaperone PCu(A)C [Pseudothioclava nitratireducens]|jgi:hypothetical protein|uniref:copper chaperone PCu(A)C n=1 Tax=Pseudothioclava nitratireducens TaxID=1928646 RepID=UPI0023D9DB2C|nr:copper chaperone PCu(A)C [Defluviimonas nitratireducens]MDF1618923.1 copper chaperone PCu(A)C [Defluviimonas nitratireducens]
MKRRSAFFGAIAMTVLMTLPAAAQEAVTDTLEISGGFTRASPMVAGAGAGFMTIRSKGPADRLVAFRSSACNTPELHTHINENGMMRMRQVEAIDIPAGGEAVLKPGSLHLMFIDLVEPMQEGTNVDVTLVFEQAGEVELSLPVKGAGAMN